MKKAYHQFPRIALSIAMWAAASSSVAQDHSDLFDRQKSGLFVVQSVDNASGNKTSVGTGFLIESEGVLASNYHVVSDHVLYPDEFELQFEDAEKRTGKLKVLDVDVINDLALLQITEMTSQVKFGESQQPVTVTSHRVPTEDEESSDAPVFNIEREELDKVGDSITVGQLLSELPVLEQTFFGDEGTQWVFELAAEEPRQGDEVVAMGNPYDIGLSLVSGIYNGLTSKGYNKHIHFTGALNPGMSGGPAVNQQGQVVGINVAGAGNSVSFLVPVDKLQSLLTNYQQAEHSGGDNIRDRITEDLKQNQADLIDDLLSEPWELSEFGPLRVPMEVRDYVNCAAGTSGGDEELLYEYHSSDCGVYDRVFLSREFDTGMVEFDYYWYSSDQLNLFQFYEVMKGLTFSPFNYATKKDVTRFSCHQDISEFPQLKPVAFKSTYCVRSYRNYQGLYDVLFYAKSLLDRSEGVLLHYTLAGVTQEKAQAFNHRFVESVQWK